VYPDSFPGHPFSRPPGSYPGRLFDPHSTNGGGYNGGGSPAPLMGQNSGPLHIPAASHGINGSGSDYYNTDPGLPQDGPNGWTMYRDPKSGEPYYHNHNSGITQWKCPDEWPMH